jgi:hypothetical protein
MVHTAVGFKGTVRQDAEARRFARAAPRFTVDGPSVWAVTATAGDRVVSISAGRGQACGVEDSTNTAESLQLPANTGSQVRYDLIVNRFTWTDPVTLPGFAYVLGVPGAGVPNRDSLTRTPGVYYDGVLAVVRVAPGQGALSPNDVFRVQAWSGSLGTLVTNAPPSYLSLVDIDPGDHIRVPPSGVLPARELFWDGTGYRLIAPSPVVTLQAPWTETAGAFGINPTIMTSIDVPDPGVPYVLQIITACEIGSTQAGTRWDLQQRVIGSTSYTHDTTLGVDGQVTLQRISSGVGGIVLTGPCTVRAVAVAAYGAALGTVTAYNRRFTVSVFAAAS